MKYLFYTALFCGLVTSGFAQHTKKDTVVVISVDSTKKEDTPKKRGFHINIDSEGDSNQSKGSDFDFDLTFSRFDLGLSKYLDNNSFTLSPENSFLENRTWKTIHVSFDVVQFQYRFNPYFKVYLAAGFDWNHIRLKQNIDILPDQGTLTYQNADVDYKKNRFSSSYLHIPLGFQFRTKEYQSDENSSGKRIYFVAGPEVAFLLNGKLKQISDERGKEKIKDDFNFNPFRTGAYARLGYGNFGLYTKYYFSDVFANSQGPSDFKHLSFGFMLNF